VRTLGAAGAGAPLIESPDLTALKKTPKPPKPLITASVTAGPNAAGSVTVAGKTYARAKVNLDIGANGSIDQTVKASSKGLYQVTFTIGFGSTPVLLSATASGHKATSTTLTVNRPDTVPPAIALGPLVPGPLSRTEVTITGNVSDVGTGVAALTAVVDGQSSPVSFGPSGSFSYTTTLPLNGTADGVHTIQFRAADHAGNISTDGVTFTLDTTGPSISATAPAGGATLTTSPTVVGTVSDPLSGVASLEAQVDNGPAVSVPVGASGSFSFPAGLASDGSANGAHSVHLMATDGAGNTSTQKVDFTLQAPTQQAPSVTIESPASGMLTRVNPTITGMVAGSTAIASLQASVDNSPPASVTFDPSTGDFSFTPDLLLDGSADGAHTVHFEVADSSGQSAGSDFPFTLIIGPSIAVTAPAEGATLTTSPTVAGTVSAQHSGLASLEAQVDRGSPVSVPVGASGSFSFPAGLATDGSAIGTHSVYLRAMDGAGNTTTQEVDFTLQASTQQAPTVTIESPVSGLLTRVNPTIMGKVAGTAIASLHAQVDNGQPASVTFDPSTGAFSFTPGLLLDGSADGAHTVHFEAADSAGQSAGTDFGFTLATVAPTEPAFNLAAADRENSAPLATTNSQVTLVGQSTPNITVALVGTGLTAQTTNSGTFQFPNVPVSLGNNALTVMARDGAGNTSQFQATIERDASTVGTNQVILWDEITLQAIEQDASTAEYASRGLAIMSASVYDAVNSIDGTPGYYVKLAAPAGASADAAVASAAYTALSYLYPAQQAFLNSSLTNALASIPDGQSKTDGESVGQSVANAIVAMRQNDGSTDFVDDMPGSAPGDWQPTAPSYAPAESPQWATLKPFAMTSDTQFQPPAPPALTSQEYAADVNETLDLGSVNSTTRTADETQIALFWNDKAGTYMPPGQWNSIADAIAQQQGDSLSQDARLFAELNIAEGDAAIVAWNAKYTYNTWRPITLAGGAGTAINSQIETIANWTPLLTTPPFPEYVSGHSTFSAAAAEVLSSVFGANFSFSATSMGLPGVTRTYTSFEQAAQEAGISRIYGGIHFPFSDTAGLTSGQELGDYVLQTFSISKDTTPPQVTLDQTLPGGASNTNVTIAGIVTDNLSGVAAFKVSVDGGASAPLSFDPATGTFSYTTTFATNGSQDGSHTIKFQATDVAGNAASPVAFTFILGTKAPVLTLTSPAAGGTLAAGATLTGTVTTSSPVLTMLNYAFDGGTVRPVAFNSDRSFSQALDLSTLSAGNHTLVVTALDAAGNKATQTLDLMQPTAIPLTVTSLTPASGSSDVGVTFRPTVTFSRPIDTRTLNGSNFHATDTTGAVVPATVVPSDDGTFAWLFFTNPLPGASTITITVDGSTIKAADGSLLDAAGSGTPGSKLAQQFTTVSTAAVPGTTLSGIVADAGPDGKPGTTDDVKPGPDGVLMTADDIYLHPIAGATVYILGQQGQAVISGPDGSFSLTSVPAGDVKLVIDGRTATSAPSGVFYPEMVFDLTIQPGVANTVMGSMGTTQEQAAEGSALGVYLPRLQTSILKPAGGNTSTTISLDPAAAQGLTPGQASEYSITVAPNSLVGMDGQKMSSGMVGFSTVEPALIRGMLPQGVMQLATTLTIQAPGVATFSTPLTLTFANVYGAAPGSQLDVYSFNHTTGVLEITGTATVSADGKTATTDPGSGITHPGWEGVTPPGSTAKTPAPSCPAAPAVPSGLFSSPSTVPGSSSPSSSAAIEPTIKYLPLLFGDTPTPDELNAFSISAPAVGMVTTVTVTVDPQLQQVFEDNTGVLGSGYNYFTGTDAVPITGGSWTLSSGESPVKFNWAGISDRDLLLDGLLEKFAIYGGVVTVNEWTGKESDMDAPDVQCPSTPSTHLIFQFFIYRYLNPVYAYVAPIYPQDAISPDVLPFPDAIQTGPGQSTQSQTLDMEVSSQAAADLTPTVLNRVAFSGSTKITFSPPSNQTYQDTLELRSGVDLKLVGTGRAPQIIYVNVPGLVTLLTNIENNTNLPKATLSYMPLSQDEKDAFSPANVLGTATAIYNIVKSFYNSAVPNAAIVSPNYGTSGTLINYYTNNYEDYIDDNGNYTLGDTGFPNGSGIDNLFKEPDTGIEEVLAHNATAPAAVLDYLLPKAINPDPVGETTIFVVSALRATFSLQSFEYQLAKSIAHEAGHTLSLVHILGTYPGGGFGTDQYPTPDSGVSDVMSYNRADVAFQATWQGDQPGSLPALKLALGQTVTEANVAAAASYYQYSYTTGGTSPLTEVTTDQSGVPTNSGDSTGGVSPALPGKFLTISRADTLNLATGADFGEQTVGGSTVQQFLIQDLGSDPVTITNATVSGDPDFRLVLPAGFDGQLAVGASLQFGIQYTPRLGPAQGTVTITSDALPLTLTLTGQGTVAGPAAQVDETNNNLGGAIIGQSVTGASAIVINNFGSSPLTITGVSFVYGGTSFSVNGLPANLTTNPITIAPNASYSLSVTYTASGQGLERGLIELTTNDPLNPTIKVGVVGTGVFSDSVGKWGNDYVAIAFPQLGADATLRLISDPAGNFNAFLPASTPYRISVFDPLSGLIADGQGVTAPSGRSTDLTSTLTFKPSTAEDSDNAGLPDDIKFALGLNPNKADTSGSGIDDFTKLQEGLPLFGNQSALTGIVANVPLGGQAEDVTLIGSTNSSGGLTAYVATGSNGLAVVDASNFQKSVVLGQITLPGNSTGVSVDPNLQIAAVASGSALNLVDVSNPTHPALLQSLDIAAGAVKVYEGVAYAAVGNEVVAVDLETGTTLATESFSGGNVDDLGIDQGNLYVLASEGYASHTVYKVVLNGASLPAPTESLAITGHPTFGRMHLFAANGYVYVGASDNNDTQEVPGVEVIQDNGTNLTYIGPSSAITAFDVTTNGSGLALYTGANPGLQATAQVGLLDLSDPTNTAKVITVFNTPGVAQSVAMADGLGFVADGAAGLAILNYLPFDTKGIPPTASISLPSSAVSGTDGSNLKVVEGSTIPVVASVADDVQVRNVELLVNGQVVENSVSAPYNLTATLPTLAQNGSAPVTIQVEAIDTGGNVGLSNTLTLELVTDTTPPQLVSSNIPDGAQVGTSFRAVILQFSKPLDESTVVPADFQLIAPGGTMLAPAGIQFRNSDRTVQLTLPRLGPGTYQFVIDEASITDRLGNPLGSGNVTSSFTVSAPPPVVTTLVGPGMGLSSPTDPAYSNGNLYVPNADSNTISEVTLAGVVSTFVDSTQGLNTPVGVTFDSLGNLYVANFHGETISKVTPAGTITTFANVNSPNSPVFGPDGNLYVCDKYDGTIMKVTPAGVVSSFVDNSHGLSSPNSLAFNGSNLYVASQNNDTIYEVTPAGNVSVLVSGGLISGPTSLVLGPHGNLYVYNSGTSEITTVTPSGVASNFVTLDPAVAGPYAGLVFDPAGNLYVANWGNSTISQITSSALVSGQAVTNQGSIRAANGETSGLIIPAPNTGVIRADVGSNVTVNGAFVQGASGTVAVSIGGMASGQFGQLAVTGSATFTGTLDASIVNGYIPVAGQSIPLITFRSSTGQFTTVNVSNLPPGIAANLVYNATNVTLVFGNAPMADAAVSAGPAVQSDMSLSSTHAVTAAIDHLLQSGVLSVSRPDADALRSGFKFAPDRQMTSKAPLAMSRSSAGRIWVKARERWLS
jgi:membrane-associated phospholipid phosphatase/sugar lactone lactonase YvrE